MQNYSIESAIHILPIFQTISKRLPLIKLKDRFVHNFWCLRDLDRNIIVAELHGLATSHKTGQIIPIGYSFKHKLVAYQLVYDELFAATYGLSISNFRLSIDKSIEVYNKKDCLSRWLKAVETVDRINSLALKYPVGGFLLSTINSNSVYRAFGEAMGIPIYIFPHFIQLGINKKIKGL